MPWRVCVLYFVSLRCSRLRSEIRIQMVFYDSLDLHFLWAALLFKPNGKSNATVFSLIEFFYCTHAAVAAVFSFVTHFSFGEKKKPQRT